MSLGESYGQQCALYTLAGLSGFLCGIYFQQETSIRSLLYLVRRDPNIYHQRHKLYPVLCTFSSNQESRLWKRSASITDKIRDCIMSPLYDMLNFFFLAKNETMNSVNLLELIKYGLPSTNNLSVHKDYIVSQDTRINSSSWICEHLTSNYQKLTNNKSGDNLNLRFNDVYVLSSGMAASAQAFKSKVWFELEHYICQMTEKFGSIYAYTGPIYLPSCRFDEDWALQYQIVDWVPVPVPSHYFKVLIIDSQLEDVPPYMEGYIVPNRRNDGDIDLRKYLSDIDEIERYTGLNFVKGLRHSVLFESDDYKNEKSSQVRCFEELTEKLLQVKRYSAEDFM